MPRSPCGARSRPHLDLDVLAALGVARSNVCADVDHHLVQALGRLLAADDLGVVVGLWEVGLCAWGGGGVCICGTRSLPGRARCIDAAAERGCVGARCMPSRTPAPSPQACRRGCTCCGPTLAGENVTGSPQPAATRTALRRPLVARRGATRATAATARAAEAAAAGQAELKARRPGAPLRRGATALATARETPPLATWRMQRATCIVIDRRASRAPSTERVEIGAARSCVDTGLIAITREQFLDAIQLGHGVLGRLGRGRAAAPGGAQVVRDAHAHPNGSHTLQDAAYAASVIQTHASHVPGP